MTRLARPQNQHRPVAARARASRGTWHYAGTYSSAESARTMAYNVRSGQLRTYQPAGDFDAYSTTCAEGDVVWVRYVAGDAPVPDLPALMTVRVQHDGTHLTYGREPVVTVTVPARCPACGGPRGTDTIRPWTFSNRDGGTFVVERWENPCGHVDEDHDVISEALRLTATAPVALVRQAVKDRVLGLHAVAVAVFLEQHGHDDEASLVRAEIKNRDGKLTAKQAAEYLAGLLRQEATR